MSVFEIATKAALGKLPAPAQILQTIAASGFNFLSLTPAHAEAVRSLPLHHRDPFDRLLVAQASMEDLVLMTSDAALDAYDVACHLI